MLQNTIKIFFRNLQRHKLFGFLNILGLASGISAAILILLISDFELSYDNFHPNVDNKYIMALDAKIGENEAYHTDTPPVLSPTLQDQMGGVLSTTRTWDAGQLLIARGDEAFFQEEIYLVDSNFFSFFGYELLQGDAKEVLNQPNEVVLTSSAAAKYFGEKNPLGKTVVVGNERENYVVTGVAADPPRNSHLQFEVLLSFVSHEESQAESWGHNELNTYAELDENVDLADFQARLDAVVEKEAGPFLMRAFNKDFEEFSAAGKWLRYQPVALSDLHLYSPDLGQDDEYASDIFYIYLLGGIGVFLLLIAAVNFMNLTTAGAATRAKEVGIKKTMGSGRKSMIFQFLMETYFYVMLAAALSLFVVYQVLPWVNQVVGTQLTLSPLTESWFILSFIGVIIMIGLIAGTYPAFYLTSFRPVASLKGTLISGGRTKKLRQSLVVGQFFISIVLIIVTMLVNEQMQFMRNKDLGINKEYSLVVKNTGHLGDQQDVFKQQLADQAAVTSASYTSHTIPGSQYTTFLKRPGETQDHVMAVFWADYEHDDVLEIEMLEGRYFDRDHKTDSSAVVMNQAAVQAFGFEEPLGKEIVYNGNHYQVVGIMEDFNFDSPVYPIEPLVIFFTETANEMIVSYKGTDPQEAISTLETTWNAHAQGVPLDYNFLDDDFAEQFATFESLGQLFKGSTAIAILIACLGLIGLSTYLAERKTKEIGIRKVLGASVISILRLFSGEFVKLIIIAFVIAAPLSVYFMQDWLTQFAYRIEIGPGIFVFTALLSLSLVVVAIGWQALKAALMNPVDSIRNE